MVFDMKKGVYSLVVLFSLLTACLHGAESRFSFTELGREPSAELLSEAEVTVGVPDALAEQGVTAAHPFGQSHFIYLAPSGDGVHVLLWHDITKTSLVGPLLFESAVSELALRAGRVAGEFYISGQVDGEARHIKLTYARDGRGLSFVDFMVMGIYLVALVWIGQYFSKREKTSDDYFEGGHKMPWWAVGVSLFATGASAVSFIGMPAMAYSTNWIFLTGGFFQLALLPIAYIVVIPIIRRLKITTAYDYLERRFGYPARVYGSVIFIALQIFARMSVTLLLPAIALGAVTGLNIMLCVAIMGVLSTAYTLLGGIQAVIWTDVIQTFLIIGAILICIVMISFDLDGSMREHIQLAASLGKFQAFDWSPTLMRNTVWAIIINSIFIQFGHLADQNYVQRIQAVESERDAKRVVTTQLLIAVPLNVIFFAMGTALFLYYRSNPVLLEPSLKTDTIFPLFMMQNLPIGVAGLVISAVFAASMSSLDSSINSVSMVIVRDYYQRLSKHADDRKALKLGKILTIVLGCFATVTAMIMSVSDVGSIWELFMMLSGLILSSVGGFFLLGIFTKRASLIPAFIGATMGTAVVLWLNFQTGASFFIYQGCGIMTTFIVGYLVSLFMRNPLNVAGLTVHDLPRRID